MNEGVLDIEVGKRFREGLDRLRFDIFVLLNSTVSLKTKA
jgi:hypothetical protein